MPRRVLIVGGCGFVGAYVTRQLVERGDYVVSLDVRQPPERLRFLLAEVLPKARFVSGSCMVPSDVFQVLREHSLDQIVYLAAIQDQAFANQHPLPVYDLHIRGLLNVLEAARLQSVRRVVVGSTTAVCRVPEGGNRRDGGGVARQPLCEEHIVHSAASGHLTGHYGASKAAAEIVAMSYFTTYGLDVIVARLTHVYGFGMWSEAYVRPAIESIARGEPVRFPTGADSLFDYTYVEDTAQGIVRCLDVDSADLTQRIFHLGNGNLRSAEEAVAILRTHAGGIAIEIGRGGPGRPEGSFQTRIDISAAREQLGYRVEYELVRGLADFLDLEQRYVRSTTSASSAQTPALERPAG